MVTSGTQAWAVLAVAVAIWAMVGAIGHWTSLKEQAAGRAHAFDAKVRSVLPGTAGGASYGDILGDLGSRAAGFAFGYGLGLGFSAGVQTLRGVGHLGRRLAGRPGPASAATPNTDAPGTYGVPPRAPGAGPDADKDGRGDEGWWAALFSLFDRAARPQPPEPAHDPHIELDDPTPYEGEILDDPANPGTRPADTAGIDDAEIVPDTPGQPDGAHGPFIPGPRTSPLPEGIFNMSALASAVARTLNELLDAAKRALDWARGASEQADQVANVAGVRARSGVVRSAGAMAYSNDAVAEAARWTANAQAAAAQNVDSASVAAIGNCVLTAGQVAARAQRIAQLSQVAAEAEAAVEAEAHLLSTDCTSHAKAAAIAHQTLTALHTLHEHAHQVTGVEAADKEFYGLS